MPFRNIHHKRINETFGVTYLISFHWKVRHMSYLSNFQVCYLKTFHWFGSCKTHDRVFVSTTMEIGKTYIRDGRS